MTDNNEIETGLINDLNNRVCHVAYTLNNAQPVISTIIGDQPFFYMDEDIDVLEEEDDDIGEPLFSLDDFHALEQHLQAFQMEETAFDRFAEDFIRTPEQYFKDYCEAKESLFAAAKPQKDIADVREVLSKSRLALAYLDYAASKNIEFKHTDQISNALYVQKSKAILVNKHLEFTDQLLLTARELRRVWQNDHVGVIKPLRYAPEDAVLVNRLLEADIHTNMVRIAWELQLSGERDLWQRIENSCLGDLANTFAREAFNDFRNINNGEAAVAVFEQWFLSERCKKTDSHVIQNMLANQSTYVVSVDHNEDTLDTALIVNLGTMPFGKNYLARHAGTLLSDPLFKEVRDRSNANFLWFVKFERSFREMEQDLQLDALPAAETDRVSASSNTTDGGHDHAAHSADVLSFTVPEHRKSDTYSAFRSNTTQKPQSADIIYLRRWSGE
jgi:hypothetical protein